MVESIFPAGGHCPGAGSVDSIATAYAKRSDRSGEILLAAIPWTPFHLPCLLSHTVLYLTNDNTLRSASCGAGCLGRWAIRSSCQQQC